MPVVDGLEYNDKGQTPAEASLSGIGDIINQGRSWLYNNTLLGPIHRFLTGHSSTDVDSIMDQVNERLTGLSDISGEANAEAENIAQAEMLAEQRAYNSAEAEKNRQWQERMSNTAYQRAVQDLEAAGLNKWLAVTGGNGASASTPSGASASSSAGDAATVNPKVAQMLLQFLASIINSGSNLIGRAMSSVD